jgi:hypothetical protein
MWIVVVLKDFTSCLRALIWLHQAILLRCKIWVSHSETIVGSCLMECYNVIQQVVPNSLKDHSIFIFRVKYSKKN